MRSLSCLSTTESSRTPRTWPDVRTPLSMWTWLWRSRWSCSLRARDCTRSTNELDAARSRGVAVPVIPFERAGRSQTNEVWFFVECCTSQSAYGISWSLSPEAQLVSWLQEPMGWEQEMPAPRKAKAKVIRHPAPSAAASRSSAAAAPTAAAAEANAAATAAAAAAGAAAACSSVAVGAAAPAPSVEVL